MSQMPTQVSGHLTAAGTILGTLQYMAPEQLEGKDADNRADIFAFGAVVYEMVTGQKAFLRSLKTHKGHRDQTAQPGLHTLDLASAMRGRQAASVTGLALKPSIYIG